VGQQEKHRTEQRTNYEQVQWANRHEQAIAYIGTRGGVSDLCLDHQQAIFNGA